MTPILFVPGLLCSAEVFAAQAIALWPYGPVMIANTLEGTTMSEIAAAILASAPTRFALVGISMGGYICFEIMRQSPERVIKLALLNTSARADTPQESQQRMVLVSQAQAGNFKPMLAKVMPSILHPARRDDPVLSDINLRMGLAVGADGFGRQSEAASGRVDSRPGLKYISVPTLILAGDSDTVIPPERSKEIAASIPKSRYVLIPDCGHASTLEQPEVVNAALVEWITAENGGGVIPAESLRGEGPNASPFLNNVMTAE
jgi:pimeloyl-ACP methyl ester carboxylesterase